MIYSLSLVLYNSEHTISRTIKIDSQVSFRQLHVVIQSAFNWSALHPYLFLKHGLKEQYAIGDLRQKDHPFLTFYQNWEILDSKNQMLSTWLKETGDNLIYNYYPAPTLNFAILVTLKAKKFYETETLYPRVTAAQHLAPAEPQAQFLHLQEQAGSHIDLTADSLTDYSQHLTTVMRANDSIISAPAHQKRDYYLKAVQEKLARFIQETPWKVLSEQAIFSVVDPESDEKIFVQVMGFSQEEIAVTIYVGEQAYLRMRQDHMPNVNFLYRLPAYSLNVRFFAFGMPDWINHPMAYWQSFHCQTDDKIFLFSQNDARTSLPQPLNSHELRYLSLALDQIFAVSELVKNGLDLTSDELVGRVILERVYSPLYQQFTNNELYFTIDNQSNANGGDL